MGRKSTDGTEDILFAEEAAGILRWATKTLLNWAYAGKIPSFKLGGRRVFRKRHILKFVERQERETATGYGKPGEA